MMNIIILKIESYIPDSSNKKYSSSFLIIAICSRDDTEMEYEILSKIASVWVLKATEDVSRKTNDGDVSRENVETLLSMEFSHPAKNSTLGLWNVNCAVTDFASYGYTWNVQGCRTRILDSSTTRCTCSRTGTFAVLMTKRPNYVSRAIPWLHFNVAQTRIESICVNYNGMKNEQGKNEMNCR